MASANFQNAADRPSYIGSVFNYGESALKEEILKKLPTTWENAHREGRIHLHDLESYGIAYNCLTLDIIKNFPYKNFETHSNTRKILDVFEYFKSTIIKIGQEQSGGIGFANFDDDLATILNGLGIETTNIYRDLVKENISLFILWCNETRSRAGKTIYYISLNIGLSYQEWGRIICEDLIMSFYESSPNVLRPNIIFKIKSKINRYSGDENYYLYNLACKCSASCMIPTFILCDSVSNKDLDPKNISVVGCRSRISNNIYGESSSIGRGNLVYTTINLPRIALEISSYSKDSTLEQKIDLFKKEFLSIADIVKDISLDRYEKLLDYYKDDAEIFRCCFYIFWKDDLKEKTKAESIFKNGTIAIGFIGLSEVIEIFTGKKFYKDEANYNLAKYLVEFMRKYTDGLSAVYNLNFSLLGTSGEFISGRFTNIDKKLFSHSVLDKEFYTNSFHVDVDSKLSAFEKISIESIFHSYCNGGCITYIEISSVPIDNVEGIEEIIEYAISCGIHYLGFNFPMDICSECQAKGVFSKCPICGSENIKNIRRVSGYLEELEYFTSGKKKEVSKRKPNMMEY